MPILVGVTLVSFTLLSYVPDPSEDPRLSEVLGRDAVVELERARFLDLPRFFNEHPIDVTARVDRALSHIAARDARAAEARSQLARLGGAALPYLLPRLDALEPTARAELATDLAPIAVRMGIDAPDASDPARAVTFWARFWEDRAIDFRPEVASRAARLFAQHGTAARRTDLVELDTFALDALLTQIVRARRRGDAKPLAGLIEIAAHATGRIDEMVRGDSPAEAFDAARRWEEWWLVHRADYVAYGGAERLVAMLLDTQYARWTIRVASLGFGMGTGRGPVVSTLVARAELTMGIVAGAIALAYACALLAGAIAAVRQGQPGEFAPLAAALFVFVLPPACIGVAVASMVAPHGRRVLAAAATLACALVASPASQYRAALADDFVTEHARTARAFGAGPWRIALRAARSAALPVVALLSVETPFALGGCFVVEKAFGLPGIGEETIRAVQTHDVAWLVSLAFCSALLAALVSLASDLALALLDPRVSSAALRHRRMFV